MPDKERIPVQQPPDPLPTLELDSEGLRAVIHDILFGAREWVLCLSKGLITPQELEAGLTSRIVTFLETQGLVSESVLRSWMTAYHELNIESLTQHVEMTKLQKRLGTPYPAKGTSLKSGDRLRHYKGNVYVVLTVGRATEHDLEDTIVYHREDFTGPVWIRPAHMFEDVVTVEGEEVPRFQLLPQKETNA